MSELEMLVDAPVATIFYDVLDRMGEVRDMELESGLAIFGKAEVGGFLFAFGKILDAGIEAQEYAIKLKAELAAHEVGREVLRHRFVTNRETIKRLEREVSEWKSESAAVSKANVALRIDIKTFEAKVASLGYG